ncbi:MAG: hypothetical protein WAL55_14440 [Candidatus Acidiferrales bacterium]
MCAHGPIKTPNAIDYDLDLLERGLDLWWASDRHLKQELPEEPTPPNQVRPSRRVSYLRPAVYVLIALVIVSVSPEIKHLISRPSRLPSAHSREDVKVAILPFEGLSNGVKDNELAEGLAKALAADIGDGRGVQVIPVSPTASSPKNDDALRQAASKLHPQGVIRGSVKYSGHELELTVELIDGASGLRLWSNQYQQSGSDLSSLEKEAAAKIAAEVERAMTSDLVQRPENPNAR